MLLRPRLLREWDVVMRAARDSYKLDVRWWVSASVYDDWEITGDASGSFFVSFDPRGIGILEDRRLTRWSSVNSRVNLPIVVRWINSTVALGVIVEGDFFNSSLLATISQLNNPEVQSDLLLFKRWASLIFLLTASCLFTTVVDQCTTGNKLFTRVGKQFI